MGIRRQGREHALQILYQHDLTGRSIDDVLVLFWDGHEANADVKRFAEFLVHGVHAALTQIDDLIAGHSTNWKISRMAAVDKNILRMAVFELRSCSDIPTKVTINEAVEIAKRFGSAESGAFVNGILDHISRDIMKSKEEGGSDA